MMKSHLDGMIKNRAKDSTLLLIGFPLLTLWGISGNDKC
jgi:hypothetical protein